MKWLCAALLSLSSVVAITAQNVPSSIPVRVSEVGGIRRTQFPVTARIPFPRGVLRDPANWWRTIQIDRGSRDGMRVDFPVLTSEGLVGRSSIVPKWAGGPEYVKGKGKIGRYPCLLDPAVVARKGRLRASR